MRRSHPFRADDLESLERLFNQVSAVVPMRSVYEGETWPRVIGLRHDVDDNEGSFDAAIAMAEWEADRGYRSTYFLLHSAGYWGQPGFSAAVRRIADRGHEVGLHANGIAESIRTGDSPDRILADALVALRQDAVVIGEVAHGDELCRDRDGGGYRFVNDEMFSECARPEMGAPDRIIKGTSVKLDPKPLSTYGLQYDSNRLPRKFYASDSGGTWNLPWDEIEAAALSDEGQLHLLIHPDWWTEAF